MNFVAGLVQPMIDNVVQAGTAAAGGFAGDLVIGAGNMISNTGQGIGNSVETVVDGWGRTIQKKGDNYISPSGVVTKTLPGPSKGPSTAAKKPPQRTLSLPSSTPKYPVGASKSVATKAPVKTATGATGAKPTPYKPVASKVPVTGKPAMPFNPPGIKTPAAMPAVKPAAPKSVTGVSTVGKDTVSAYKPPVASAVKKPYPGTVGAKPGAATPKPYPGTVGAKTATTPKPYPGTTGATTTTPKPYPGTSVAKPAATTPKPYPGTSVAKTAASTLKPYPGTTTLPSQAGKSIVNSGLTPKAPAAAAAGKSFF